MPSQIDSMADLPDDVREKESSTFSFGKVKQILTAGYYTGPAEHSDSSRSGMRAFALRGDPSSHRKSILRKATETNLLEETPEGYATTPHGADLLDKITICDECGSDQSPYIAGIKTGRVSGYGLVHTQCPSCDDPLNSVNVEEFTRSDEQLKEAIETMESNGVVCYLNGKDLSQAKSDLGIP